MDKAGYLDRDRLGIGGHSYGAFSTVNAMTHTPYFKAGIAGDGMYNRTLTPFGFQSERRDFWEAKDTYLDMSPFLYADRLSGALLMYHSLEDQNVGTDPISSIRMMQALQGLGKQAALYMYPYEDHGPATRESDLDQWARWIAWFDMYVKNPQKKRQAGGGRSVTRRSTAILDARRSSRGRRAFVGELSMTSRNYGHWKPSRPRTLVVACSDGRLQRSDRFVSATRSSASRSSTARTCPAVAARCRRAIATCSARSSCAASASISSSCTR